ncbi:chromatin assembly factor 1 subunit A-domain-containing protein [Exophiala viscosa]|uniref:Chromatin assembly factor 1 subunit A-domain-containing protein n=1 Tax=Exophiala viscosa TaxID=2486360 RepID=A0AAN6DZP5_9EURO|nr:chromatin assembly factor 1 subunit A-domain-containing protein [Exophiala viscosa]
MDPETVVTTPGAPASAPQQLTPTSKKRNYKGEIVNHSSTLTPPVEQQRTPITGTRSRSVSPALSRASTPLTELGSTPHLSPSQSGMAPSDSKKRKLTFAEREVEKALRLQEKGEKERQKEEKERQKAEARAKKEEEKKAKEAAKEQKQKQKDAERERKAAEALKKERAQMRIGAFFGRPALTSTPPLSPDDVSQGTRSRRSSIASIDMEEPFVESKTFKPPHPEYRKWINPFFVHENVELAPFNRFHSAKASDDDLPINQPVIPEKVNTRFHKRRRLARIRPVKQIMEEVGLADAPVDLTGTTDALATIPIKYMFFHQDIRPPYQGTYTRVVSPRRARRIALNPSVRALPDTNYDYDSEAEWQEPEEGDDDLMDEDEKSEDEDGEEEMDDFLDDEGAIHKRQALVTEMEPKSSGLCWEGMDAQPSDGIDLSIYRMDVLHDSTTFPIDPYSTNHWSDLGKTSPKKREKALGTQVPMQPPRLPLMAVDGNSGTLMPSSTVQGQVSTLGQTENTTSNAKVGAGTTSKSGKPVKMIQADLLPAFRDAVSGSPLTKLGLTEVLKQLFKQCPKDAIKNTLETIAVRQGGKEAGWKWVLIN